MAVSLLVLGASGHQDKGHDIREVEVKWDEIQHGNV